jgi:two-component system chemotaxis response regulator CheB
MTVRDVIVVGASAGGIDALAETVRGLPAGLPATLFVVCHFPSGGRSVLPEILSPSGAMLATHAADGEAFHPGHIYIAPPDFHLLVEAGGTMRLSHSARENNHRPAVDPLFRSAARHFGQRVIGVVLSGGLYDGTAGLMAIRAAGGTAVVQDLRDAAVAAMPQSAAEIAGADFTAPAAGLAALLIDLVRGNDSRRTGAMNPAAKNPVDPIEQMDDIVEDTMNGQARNERLGKVSTFTCPECGGSLWQVNQPNLVRFRCHTGHAYNGEALLAEQTESLEAALWTAARTFREKSVLSRQLATRERERGNETSALRFEEQSTLAEQYYTLIVEQLLSRSQVAGASSAAG